jgi:hemoglobin
MAPRSLVFLALLIAGSSSAFAQNPPAQTGSLCARLGGPEKVAAIASQAIDQLAAAPRPDHSFNSADLDDAKLRLAAQICSLAGGDCAHSNSFGRDARADSHFATSEFRALVEELRRAMRAQDVPLAARNELLELLAPINRDVARL